MPGMDEGKCHHLPFLWLSLTQVQVATVEKGSAGRIAIQFLHVADECRDDSSQIESLIDARNPSTEARCHLRAVPGVNSFQHCQALSYGVQKHQQLVEMPKYCHH